MQCLLVHNVSGKFLTQLVAVHTLMHYVESVRKVEYSQELLSIVFFFLSSFVLPSTLTPNQNNHYLSISQVPTLLVGVVTVRYFIIMSIVVYIPCAVPSFSPVLLCVSFPTFLFLFAHLLNSVDTYWEDWLVPEE